MYYLADGIYPDYETIVKSSNPTARKHKSFSGLQEGVQKCVERVFSVLFKQFGVLYRGAFGASKASA